MSIVPVDATPRVAKLSSTGCGVPRSWPRPKPVSHQRRQMADCCPIRGDHGGRRSRNPLPADASPRSFRWRLLRAATVLSSHSAVRRSTACSTWSSGARASNLTRGPISRLITSSTSPTNAPRRRPIASNWPWRSAWRTLPQRLRGLQGPHASADGDVGTGSRRTSHASTPPIASTTACSTMAGHSDRVSSTIAVKKRPNRPVRMTPASPW